jgi:hypothetical protein
MCFVKMIVDYCLGAQKSSHRHKAILGFLFIGNYERLEVVRLHPRG